MIYLYNKGILTAFPFDEMKEISSYLSDLPKVADHTDVADHTSLTGQVDHADQAELMFRRRIRMRESLLQQKFKLDSRLKLRQCNRFNVIHCSVDPGLSLFWQYSFNRIIYLASR